MAKNYTLAEAAKVIAEGKDYEALQDIGRRFPLLMNKMTKLVTLAPEAVEIFGYMPDYLTANKINKAIKEENLGDTEVDEDEDAEEVTEEKPEKKAEKPAKKNAAKSKKAKEVEEDDEEVDEENPYAGKNAPELYKECKKRGIKVEAKKNAKYYEKALLEADAADANADSEDEDWEDEKPVKKEKPAKKAKKQEEEDDEDWDI